MHVVYAGTPDFAVPALRALIAAGDAIFTAVLTAPDRSVGRGRAATPSAVKVVAEAARIPVLQPETIGRSFARQIAELQPDVLVAVAFGKIFRPYFLDVFPRGGINVHPSLLPELRGPAPIPAAILRGDRETGVTVQRLAEQMDSGDILQQRSVPLAGRETTASLTVDLAVVGAEMLLRVLRSFAAGTERSVTQVHQNATYCGLIQKEIGRVDWSAPAVQIERAVRAYQPWPRAFTTLGGRQLLIDEARVVDQATAAANVAPGTILSVDKREGILIHTGGGQLYLARVQLQGKRPTSAAAFANGYAHLVGQTLGRNLIA